MNKHQNSGRNRFRALVTIVTALCLIIGTCAVVAECCKISKAGLQLIICEERGNDQELEELYHSDDIAIAVFCSTPVVTRCIVWIVALLAIPGIPFMVTYYVIENGKSESE